MQTPSSVRQAKTQGRLYCLDALRGIAALSIVFWHWQHMFFNPRVGEHIDYVMEAQPFYRWFSFLYHYGDGAVTVFFVLSGFVFYWLYSESIAQRRTPSREFAVLRFSRLFPLHALTFALVVVLQLVYSGAHHIWFVYPQHGWFLAVKTLLGVNSWQPHSISGFNGPFWSVSIELLLYVVFFLICRLVSRSMWVALALVVLGLALRHQHLGLSRGLIGFFMGGASYHVYVWIQRRGRPMAWLAGAGCATLATWAILAMLARVLHMENYPTEPIYACMVVTFALGERLFPNVRTGLAVLGDISYSTYLLHFPLQLVFILVNGALGGNSDIFYRGWTLVLFFATLVPLSFLSYRFFELPALTFLRNRLDRPRRAVKPAVEAVPLPTVN